MPRENMVRVRLNDREMACLTAMAEAEQLSRPELIRNWIKAMANQLPSQP